MSDDIKWLMVTRYGTDTYEGEDVPVDYEWAKREGLEPKLYRCAPYEEEKP